MLSDLLFKTVMPAPDQRSHHPGVLLRRRAESGFRGHWPDPVPDLPVAGALKLREWWRRF